MVKIGFAVEGSCERIILKSPAFQAFLVKQSIEQVGDIVDMVGKGNLKPNTQKRHMEIQVQGFRDLGAEWIIVLRDLDEAASAEAISRVKAEVYRDSDIVVCLAIHELEAWFLADTGVLSTLFGSPFYHEYPETVPKPFDYISEQKYRKTGKGLNNKKIFAKFMRNNGFSIERAAGHPNCPSARYFLNKLQTLASAN
ncbi:DUF4276 family protein [Fibrella sp. ES10-3-2-2]|nr:hypothetical protein A6C57_02405 [Fibrella sp. ES10-3-2-2]